MFDDPLEKLKKELDGLVVNSHAHIDRFETHTLYNDDEYQMFLEEKWKLIKRVKETSSVGAYTRRMNRCLIKQFGFGTDIICSFIDLDTEVGSKAIDAANKLQDLYRGSFFTACQTLKGILDKPQRELFESNIHKFDIIGSLPNADKGKQDEHIALIFKWAKEQNKRVHVHIDQLNSPEEKETEWLAKQVMKHNMEGLVTGVHAISLSCHPKEYRKDVYKMCKDAKLSFIACPSAWIDHKRNETLTPTHNSVTPVDEMLENDIVVAIGTDNINDVYKPYCNGDLFFELRLLLEVFKIYDVETLRNIAWYNGLYVLGESYYDPYEN